MEEKGVGDCELEEDKAFEEEHGTDRFVLEWSKVMLQDGKRNDEKVGERIWGEEMRMKEKREK